jgi:hypothetical protein
MLSPDAHEPATPPSRLRTHARTLKGKSEKVEAYALRADDQILEAAPVGDVGAALVQPCSSAGVLVTLTILPSRKTRTLTVFPITSPAISR